MTYKISLLLFFTFLSFNGLSQGIEFSELSYEQALAKAKAEHKNIFIDVYTTWCGPCKKMAAEVFPLKEVGDFFNAKFVNLKLDAENESTHGFFKKYKATAFPCYYWIDSNGELLHVEIGASSAPAFLKLAEKANSSDLMATQKRYAERWAAGEHSMELINKYVYGILGKVNPAQVRPHVETFLKGLSAADRQTPEISRTLKGYMSRPVEGIIFDYIIRDAKYHARNIGYLEFNQSMYRMIVRNGNAALAMKQHDAYQKHIDLITKSPVPEKAMYMEIIKAEYALNTGDYNKGFKEMVEVAQKYGTKQPYLYKEFCYSLLSSGCFLKAKFNMEEHLQLIHIAEVTLELFPSKEAVTYLAAAYAMNGDYKKAYEISAASPFYDNPLVPGIVIKNHLGIEPKISTPFGSSDKKADMEKLLTL